VSGYRDRTAFDPSAGGGHGRPLRPYNWVQWLGVASLFVGAAVSLAYIGGSLGLVPKLLDSPMLGTAFVVMALPLINSRRQDVPLSPETRRQRTIIIAAAFAVCIAVAALVIVFKGA
jgi:hypothetical protein